MSNQKVRGGWFKMYSEFRDDPKILRLSDLAFRCLLLALAFANESPWEFRRKGLLYHGEDFPVTKFDFQHCLPLSPPEKVEKALAELCSVGGLHHSFLVFEEPASVYRIRNWRKWQEGLLADFATKKPPSDLATKTANFTSLPPASRQDSTEISPYKTVDSRRYTLDKAKASVGAVAPPAAKRGKKLDASQNGQKQAAIDYFYRRLQNFTGAAQPEFAGGQAAAFFARRILKGDTPEDFRMATDLFFNERIREKSAANFSLFQRAYNAFLKQIIAGEHGREKTRNARETPET